MERSSFFNAEIVGYNDDGTPKYDREYLTEDFARYFATFIGNGIFPNPANQLQVLAIDNNMQIRIKRGYGWINGYMYQNTDDKIFILEPADGVLSRIDRIVLRLDFLNREIKSYIKKGNYASSPVAQSLQRDEDAYEIALADIYVRAGAISIAQANITDLRLNKDLCGVVHGTVDQVDTTAIFNQYLSWFEQTKGQSITDISNLKTQFENDFNIWFNTIKNTLAGDIAGNLQNQINDLKNPFTWGRLIEK